MGTIRATSNGGARWIPQTSGTTEYLYSVAFTDASHGCAVGGNGTILTTSDGGTHWTVRRSGGGLDLVSVTFADATHGWAAGQMNTILATSDRGATWTTQRSGFYDGRLLYSVDFADATHGWAAGTGGRILATADGGTHWAAQSSGLTTAGIIYSFAFVDATRGWAVGRDGSPASGVILVTGDGGSTWSTQSASNLTSATPLYAVSSADATHVWAAGWDGIVCATQDGGSTWSAQTWGGNYGLVSVFFTDTTHGWAVGGGGTILATVDGGAGAATGNAYPVEPSAIAKNRSFDTRFEFHPAAGFYQTTMSLNFYRLSASGWGLSKTLPVSSYDDGADLSLSGEIRTSLPASGKWKVTLSCVGDSADASFTSRPTYFTVRPSYSTVRLSSNRSTVSYNTHNVTFTGRLLINGKSAKYKYVKLYKNGHYFKTLKTDAYGRVKTVVSVGFGKCQWQLRYSGTSTVASSRTSGDLYTAGRYLYDFTDTGNLLEYPYLRAGHRYQVRLIAGYRVDLYSPSGHTVYHKYSTFSFTCGSTGTWKLYAANHNIFDGQPVEVAIW
jgi:photosystem II stability/assembly factor-like uncharacterized protein